MSSLGIGSNPMVGYTVAYAVNVALALNKKELPKRKRCIIPYGVRLLFDSFPLEKDGTFAVFLPTSRNGGKQGVDGHHIVFQPCDIPASPKGIGRSVVVHENLCVDGMDLVFFPQSVFGRERIALRQGERTVGAVGDGRIHVPIHRRVDVPFVVMADGFAGCPVFFRLGLREIGSVKTPMDKVLRLPERRRACTFQSPSVAVRRG